MVNCGKSGLMRGRSTLHITLEMSEEKVAKRYIQALYSMSSDDVSQVRIPSFKRNELGHCTAIDFDVLEPKLLSEGSRAVVSKKLKGLKNRAPLLIKEFATGSLTMGQLNAYLDYLDKQHNFRPDQLLLDSPDLMHLSTEQLRLDTGRLFINLRGMGIQRNMAIVATTQGNRISQDAKRVTGKMVAEDWSKIGTADIILTGAKTEQEEKLGLARLWVEKNRDHKRHYEVLIAQAYPVGQFCLDSVYMNMRLGNDVKRLTGEEPSDAD